MNQTGPKRPADNAPPGWTHIPSLDGLRGVAIVAVVIHHSIAFEAVDALGDRLKSVSEFAAHGVDLFFALSGFLIVGQLARNSMRAEFVNRFWLGRLAKIVPVYALALVTCFALLKYLLRLSGHGEKLFWLDATRGNWPWYAFFVSNIRNALDGRFTNPALDVSWSLGIEVQFYLLVFLAACRVRRERWSQLALVPIVGAFLFRGAEIAAGANWIQILVLTPGRLDAFAFGAMVALRRDWISRIPFWGVAVLMGWPFLFGWSRESSACQLWGYTAVGLFSAVAIEHASQPVSSSRFAHVLTSRPLRFFGKISYSVYLTHLPIRAVLRDRFLPQERLLSTPMAWLTQLIFTIGTCAVCLVVGWCCWRIFEEPVRRGILQWYTAKRSTPKNEPKDSPVTVR